MAKYKKVKRYHRSFYSPGMWVKKAVGIIVLVAVVLVVGWLAAPHVLDWATHTWPPEAETWKNNWESPQKFR